VTCPECGSQRKGDDVRAGLPCPTCSYGAVPIEDESVGPALPPGSGRRRAGAGWAGALPKGPNGHALCRYCQTEVAPPRRTFCSEACVHAWKVESQPAYARSCVAKRDGGVCAGCGVETEAWELAFAAAKRIAWSGSGAVAEVCERWRAMRQLLRAAGRIDSRGHWWEMDHIVEVVRGGGACGMDNLQTLCIRCHKVKTARLAAERKAERAAR